MPDQLTQSSIGPLSIPPFQIQILADPLVVSVLPSYLQVTMAPAPIPTVTVLTNPIVQY